jgi:hypothetical protein
MLNLSLGLLVAIGTWAALIDPAAADHPYPSNPPRQFHIVTIHSTTQQENACADSHTGDTTVTDAYARTKIINTLKYDNTAEDWHQITGTDHLFFTISSGACSGLSYTDLEAKELWYHVFTDDNAAAECAVNDVAGSNDCAVTRHAVTDCTGGCHTDYYHYYVVHSRSTIYDGDGTATERRHIINHETGHALGLDDPSDPDGDGYYEPCTDISIMHRTGYCPQNTNYTWPTQADKDSVERNIYRP